MDQLNVPPLSEEPEAVKVETSPGFSETSDGVSVTVTDPGKTVMVE